MQERDNKGKAVIVTGPTASGKSSLAISIAQALDGVIINADSMQLYRELRILTARPSEADEARAPHRLYGVLSAAEPANAAWWRTRALTEIDAALAAGKLPILTGGTGLYLRALTEGLSGVPQVAPKIREESRQLLKEIGSDALHEKLAAADPVMGARLKPSDSQRLARAWEVLQATGRSLSEWQEDKGVPAPYDFTRVMVLPDRETLRAAIAGRFQIMLARACGSEAGSQLASHEGAGGAGAAGSSRGEIDLGGRGPGGDHRVAPLCEAPGDLVAGRA